MGCSHAIYTVRNTINRFINGGSTVNVFALDLSKAFDKVNHSALCIKRTTRRLPCSRTAKYTSLLVGYLFIVCKVERSLFAIFQTYFWRPARLCSISILICHFQMTYLIIVSMICLVLSFYRLMILYCWLSQLANFNIFSPYVNVKYLGLT